MSESQTPEASETKAPRERSPSFPFISLKAALERLTEFDEKFGRNPPPADRVYLAWGYSGDTSQAQQTLGALKSFGMVEYSGSGKKRQVVITDDARTYLRAQQTSIRKSIVAKLALNPPIFQKFWENWGASRPPDEVCLDELVLTYRFNENTAPRFLQVYDATIDFASLSDATSNEVTDVNVQEGVIDRPAIKVGDYVQVEIGGELKLAKPVKVREITKHEGQDWVAIEGTESWFPLSQILLESSEASTSPTPPPFSPKARENSVGDGSGQKLNDIRAEIWGGTVRINATLDIDGLDALEKKIAAYKILLS